MVDVPADRSGDGITGGAAIPEVAGASGVVVLRGCDWTGVLVLGKGRVPPSGGTVRQSAFSSRW